MDATVLRVYEKRHKSTYRYTAEEMTPADIRTHTDLNIHYYAFIKTAQHADGICIDISTLMQEQMVGQTYTWDDFCDLLTPVLVDSYTVTSSVLPSLNADMTHRQATVVHPLTTVGLEIAYCDKRNTTEFNKFYKRWDLPDLAIWKKENYKKELSDLQLEHCIASINGYICNTAYFNDILYISEGAKNLWCINKYTTPNIDLIDVSHIGTLTRLPFSQCEIVYMDGAGDTIYDRDIKLIVPEQYNFKQYTPLISFAGKLYFPDELTISNNRTIILKPYTLQIPEVLLGRDTAQAKYIPDTEILHPEVTAVEYLSQLGKTDASDIYDVVYLIDNTNIFIERNKVTKDLYWLTKFNDTKEGILMRKHDRSIMDYTTIEYDDYYLHHGVVYPTDHIRIVQDDEYDRPLGIRTNRCVHKDEYFRSSRDSLYELIYLNS